ncbi:MAG: CoA-binding protein [Rhizomicrobium sp.]
MAAMTYPDSLIKTILRSVETIAMVGASGNEIRPSYFAMMYLLNKGYRIVPVNPGLAGQEILGQKVYGSLKDVPAPVDMIDIFRDARFAPEIVREALSEKSRLGFKFVWMQLGIVSGEAARLAEEAGLTVIMDRCPKIEYGRFSGELGWMGVNRKVIDNRRPLLFGKGGSLKRL